MPHIIADTLAFASAYYATPIGHIAGNLAALLATVAAGIAYIAPSRF